MFSFVHQERGRAWQTSHESRQPLFEGDPSARIGLRFAQGDGYLSIGRRVADHDHGAQDKPDRDPWDQRGEPAGEVASKYCGKDRKYRQQFQSIANVVVREWVPTGM